MKNVDVYSLSGLLKIIFFDVKEVYLSWEIGWSNDRWVYISDLPHLTTHLFEVALAFHIENKNHGYAYETLLLNYVMDKATPMICLINPQQPITPQLQLDENVIRFSNDININIKVCYATMKNKGRCWKCFRITAIW